MSILGTGLWLGEGDEQRLADSIAGRATVVCLKGKIHEFGPTLELPAAADVVYVGRRFTMGGWRLACWCVSGPCHARHIASLVNALPVPPSAETPIGLRP